MTRETIDFMQRDIDNLAASMERNGGDRYDAQRLAEMCKELERARKQNQPRESDNEK